MSSSMIC